MKNKEKYADDIFAIATKGYAIAYSKSRKELISCEECPCWDCIFTDVESCCDGRRDWFESEVEHNELEAEIARLTAENAALRERLDKTIELPSGDRVWYIAKDEEGQESYIIPKPTSSLTVEELKYEMDKKYFSTREAAEARLKEIQEGKK